MNKNKNQKNKVQKLVEEGNHCLEDGDYEEALKIASQLEEMGQPQAFEIAAKAYELQDNLEEAVNVLKRGVELYPEDWPNWMILGNLLSNMEQNEEAESAYEKALACPDVEKDPVVLNQAIHAMQMGQLDRATELLSGITSDYLDIDKREVQIAILKEKKELQQAITLAEETLKLPIDIEENSDVLGRISATLCKIKLENGEDKASIQKIATEAIEKYGDAPWLFAILCEIEGQYSKDAHYFQLLFKVELEAEEKDEEEAEYFVNFDVVADTEDEALELVQKFETRKFVNMTLEESEKVEPRPEDPKGVYWRSEVFYFVDEE